MNTDEKFAEKLTPHLQALATTSEAIHKMYVFDPVHENIPADIGRDLLNEKNTTNVFGVVRKYEGQVLVLLSYTCAANCRYCERQDRVGVGLDAIGRLTFAQIDTVIGYINADPTIYEVIASGGDPLTHPKGLAYLFERLSEVLHVKVLRIHTRFPLQFPNKVNLGLMKNLAKAKQVVFLSLHIDHPDELQPECISLIKQFKSMGFILLSQSVFLKGVNDDKDLLKHMFLTLFEHGVRPYYIYHCQEILTTTRFVMRLEDEVAIMTLLRNELSGLAFPQHVIDIPNATGKVLVPSGHWQADLSKVIDFKGEKINATNWLKA